MKLRKLLLSVCILTATAQAQTTPIMETGGQSMPNEWIDKDTGHKVIKLTRREGLNQSFYFHNNPFIGEEMIFCGGETKFAGNDNLHGAGPKEGLQLYAVNLKTLDIRQLTNEQFNVNSEVVCPATKEIFYQNSDTVFALNV